MQPKVISNKYGVQALQLEPIPMEWNPDWSIAFSVDCPSVHIDGQIWENDGYAMEWLYIQGKATDSLLIQKDGYSYILICSLLNSIQLSITGNGQTALHERGIQFLYSPYRSISVQTEANEEYMLCTIRLTTSYLEGIQRTCPSSIVSTDFLHPRFLLKGAVILQRKHLNEFANIGHLTDKHSKSASTSCLAPFNLLFFLLDNHQPKQYQSKQVSREQARLFYSHKNKIQQQILPLTLPDSEHNHGINLQNATFIKLLKQLYGMTFREFTLEHRMILAAEMLRENTFTIKQIAFQTGFANVYHFTRVFTRFHKESPGKYHKKYGL